MAGNRTLSQVQTIAELAKLDQSDLEPRCQCLYFGAELNAADMVLMEVEDSVLAFLERGNSVVIRGEKTDSAVLCLDAKTYDVKDTDTSNTLLILPACSTTNECKDSERQIVNRQVIGLAKSYYEVKPMRPRLRKLRSLLEECPYGGDVYEEEASGKRYSLEDILDVIQASEVEIKEELKTQRACHINGFWRMLHFDYECQLLSHILSLVEENSWDFHRIPLKETLDTLENLEPRAILEHTLECFGERLPRQDSKGDHVFYCLNEDKVCQMFAEMLLRPAEKFNLAEFLLSWQQSVPDGMATGMHQLQGIAIIDRNSKPEVIFHFPFSLMPENEVDRFNFLFKTRDRWTQEEILPYIQDLVTEKLSAAALLQKHARASVGANGVRVYNSKRPIK
ncbi:sister chromatid cohesion protein DCC1-like [Acanthaster planci]|uniref:Sister chromatid cohesion protein DCC1 n=1 Tax=Acanthaster planci TaxID=133434 RepID=A0A8B7Y6U1_ACAPL|nr:sister chromatid cohesion protein DCC1-like [Acanthaster planci]